MVGVDDKRVRITYETQARGDGGKKAAKQAKEVREETDKLDTSMKRTAKTAKELEEDIAKLGRRRQEVARELTVSDDKNLKSEFNWLQRRIGYLEKLKRTISEDLEPSSKGIGFAMPELGSLMAPGIGVGAVAAAGALPAVGAGLAGLVGGAGVVAGMAGAIAASIKSPQVQAAAKSFGGDLMSTFFGAGNASIKPVTQSLAILSDDVKRLGLAELFAKAAPAITVFAGGIGDLVTNLMPGFNRLMDDAEPYAEALADGLSDTGKALSSMLKDIADSNGDIEGLRGLFDLINGTIIATGKGVGWLSDKWVGMNAGLAEWTGALEDVYPSWMPVHQALKEGNDLTEQYSQTGEGFTVGMHKLNVELRDHAQALRLAELGAQNAADRTKNYVDWLHKMQDALSDASDKSQDLYRATLDQKDGLRQFKEQLAENKGQWDANTEAGHDNLAMLDDQIRKAQQVRDAAIAMGDGTEASQKKAIAAYNHTVDQLLKLAAQAGLTKDQMNKLAGVYKVTIYVDMAFSKAATDWSELRNKERQTQGSHPDTPYAPAGYLTNARAAGGPVMAGVPYMINEAGRETVTFGTNGYVHPANLTPAGAAQNIHVTIGLDPSVSGSSRSLAESLLQLLRAEVWTQGGGNVQTALGR